METYSFGSLADQDLGRELDTYFTQDRTTTAGLLARIAEFDARKLYLPAGYESMFAYCVDRYHLCEQAALKRIRAARTARRFPVIFEALADGRLHLIAVIVLGPHLTHENAAELLRAAEFKKRSQIEELVAAWFPSLELTMPIHPIPSPSPTNTEVSPGTVGGSPSRAEVSPGTVGPVSPANSEVSPGTLDAPARTPVLRSKLEAIAPERFVLQLVMSRSTRDKLRHAQDLLGHALPSGDVTEVFDRALDALISRLEGRKCARTDKPRPVRGSNNPRYVPASVRRAVWERDGGCCSFVSESGHRCASRRFLEYDHVDEVARGGLPTADGIRLRCRAHNQFTAERTFGEEFMSRKRLEATEARSSG